MDIKFAKGVGTSRLAEKKKNGWPVDFVLDMANIERQEFSLCCGLVSRSLSL